MSAIVVCVVEGRGDSGSEEEPDFLDFELVQLDDEVKDIFSIRLNDTTEDKMIFTVSS